MEKFGMSFGGGGGPSKKELLDTIESQKKQLLQYQTRFKDVVRAYKSLLKEKEALEASLKVLTVSQELDLSQRSETVTSDLPDDHCSLHSEDSVDTAASAETATSITSGSTRGEPGEEERGGSAAEMGPSLPQSSEPEASSPESGGGGGGLDGQVPHPGAASGPADGRLLQLKTLTASLATVTQEKSRMEANFQADKRMMKQEIEDLHEKLKESQSQQEAELQALQEQLTESKARVITQQHEREQEQGDHALMLRELQKLLQEERDLRQDAELRLEDAKDALLEATQAAERGAELQGRLRELTHELEEMRKRTLAAEAEKNKPDPQLEELQQELAELKNHFQQQLQLETKKACQAEDRARQHAQAEEGRVASLEERVSELSQLLGACEAARHREQQTIHRLRDRVLQLDTENKTLAIAASSRDCSDLRIDEANLDVNVLKEKLEKDKRLLLLASQRNPERSLEMEKLVEVGSGTQTEGMEISEGEKASALFYQQELRQVKEEFERYKVRAQLVLKNKNTKDGCQARELEEAREQLAELKEKYITLRIHSDQAAGQQQQALEEQTQAAAALQHRHKQELERVEAQHRERLLRLEEELHGQRDRTMALLADKDRELDRLRASAFGPSPASTRGCCSHQGEKAADPGEGANGGGSVSDNAGLDDAMQESDIIAQALRMAGPTEPTLLLYVEQLARKEVEVGLLRRQKHQLEEDLHQLQGRLIANGERHEEEATELRLQLDKLQRDQNREGSNLEYLKNIIYKFLTLQDTRGRQQTLTAILTILHFSPSEKQAVAQTQGQSWWHAVR